MADQTLWVFGYGSLMWDPGFDFTERQIARLDGYHRSFCMRSVHHRGTAEKPGLVLALDAAEGHHCDGIALSVAPEGRDATIEYLRERELISSAYLEMTHPVTLRDGREVEALAYVVDPHHVQYCGRLDPEEQAAIIAAAVGGRGPNADYLYNTALHLTELGIEDPELSWLARRVRALAAG